jgi:hypothetical protein
MEKTRKVGEADLEEQPLEERPRLEQVADQRDVRVGPLRERLHVHIQAVPHLAGPV